MKTKNEQQKLEEIILDSCGGSRNATEFFAKLSDEAYIGYQTAIVSYQNMGKISITPSQVYETIKTMITDGRI